MVKVMDFDSIAFKENLGIDTTSEGTKEVEITTETNMEDGSVDISKISVSEVIPEEVKVDVEVKEEVIVDAEVKEEVIVEKEVVDIKTGNEEVVVTEEKITIEGSP